MLLSKVGNNSSQNRGCRATTDARKKTKIKQGGTTLVTTRNHVVLQKIALEKIAGSNIRMEEKLMEHIVAAVAMAALLQNPLVSTMVGTAVDLEIQAILLGVVMEVFQTSGAVGMGSEAEELPSVVAVVSMMEVADSGMGEDLILTVIRPGLGIRAEDLKTVVDFQAVLENSRSTLQQVRKITSPFTIFGSPPMVKS